MSTMSEAHYFRSMHSRGFYPKAPRVFNMDFELHPTGISLKERSFNVLVAPREHFIAMLNRNLKPTAIQSTLCYRQLFWHPQQATSEVHGAGDQTRLHHFPAHDHP
jgi:hypothetical protein